jgi:UDP-N-acetylglucosamine acyltransferase
MPIHPTAVVDPHAEIGDGVSIGPYAVVGAGVMLGPDVELMAHAVVLGRTILHARCRVFPGAVLGAEPQDVKYRGEPTRLVVGEGTIFREGSTAHRGSVGGNGETLIGSGCLLLAQSHVAHDCRVGDSVILSNSVALAGHSEVGDHAVLGGMAGLHQNARVGRCAMVGAGAMCSQDVPPFVLAQGDRARLFGLNTVGLHRIGLDPGAICALKAAYYILFRSGLPLGDAVSELRSKALPQPEVAELLDFVASSRRGVARASNALNGH